MVLPAISAAEFPYCLPQRKIPRRDAGDHADRLAPHVTCGAGGELSGGLSGQHATGSGEVPQRSQNSWQLFFGRRGDRLAGVDGFDPGEFGQVLREQIGQGV